MNTLHSLGIVQLGVAQAEYYSIANACASPMDMTFCTSNAHRSDSRFEERELPGVHHEPCAEHACMRERDPRAPVLGLIAQREALPLDLEASDEWTPGIQFACGIRLLSPGAIGNQNPGLLGIRARWATEV